MPSANLNQQGEYLYYDPAVHGVSASALTVKTGSVAATSTALTLTPAANAFLAYSTPAFVMGTFRAVLTLAVPSATAVYRFGLFPAVGSDTDSAYFKTETNGKLSFVTHDKDGNEQKTTIDWDAAWTAAATEFQIVFLTNERVEFHVAGIRRAVHGGNVPMQAPRHYMIKMDGAAAAGSLSLLDFRSSKVMASVPNQVTVGGTVSVAGTVTEANSADILTEVTDIANNISVNGSLSEVNPATTTSSVAMVSSTALEKGHVGKASAGYLFQVSGYNSSASDLFLQVFDSATEPAEGTAPKILAAAPSESQFGWAVERFATPFTNGIYVCLSSTAATKTVAGAVAWFNILRT